MEKIIVVLFAFLFLALPGCFFSRSLIEAPINATKIGEIVEGVSTKEDVVRILGAPTDILFNNREHDPLNVFAYEYTYNVSKTTGLTLILVTFLNSDMKRDHVLVFFDEKGIVCSIGTRFDARKAKYRLPFGG